MLGIFSVSGRQQKIATDLCMHIQNVPCKLFVICLHLHPYMLCSVHYQAVIYSQTPGGARFHHQGMVPF